MTNIEIIAMECAMRGISEQVHTFATWKSLGYSVKKGEKACFQTNVWKAVKDKKDDSKEKLINVKTSFFTQSQVKETKVKSVK